MALFTRETIEKQLNAWLEANIAVSQGQSYTIGTRTLTRANSSEILKQIKYWQNESTKLDNATKKKATNKVYRIVPRD